MPVKIIEQRLYNYIRSLLFNNLLTYAKINILKMHMKVFMLKCYKYFYYIKMNLCVLLK